MGDEVQASWDTWGPQTSNPMPGQKTHSGRKRICSEEMLAQVHETVEKSSGKSSRRKCQELDLTRSTMLRVMGKDLKKFPYRISIRQSLLEVQKMYRRAVQEPHSQSQSHDSMAAPFSGPESTGIVPMGVFEGKIYANNPTTLLQLKKNITEAIRGTQKPMLKSANAELCSQTGNSVDRKGAHM